MLQHTNPNLYENTTIITGLGRMGTTFLAHVFYNAGYDLGHLTPENNIGRTIPNGGLELHNIDIIEQKGLPRNKSPRIVKNPTFGRHLDRWLKLGQRPKDAILLCRNMESCYQSHKTLNHKATKEQLHDYWYTALRNLTIEGIPTTIIPFPEIATNPNLAKLLTPWIPNPHQIIQQTYNQHKVHH